MSRRWTLAWVGCAVLSGLVGESARAASWAEGLFAEKGHDFGAVPRGVKLRHPFVLTNRLGEPVTIVNVHASCGCTSGKASASVVAAGQTAVVEAEMDTRNFVARKETVLFVTVMTPTRGEAEARLGVASTILSDIVLNPGQIGFGTVTRGQPAPQTLTIDRIGSPGWKVERMVSACRAIDATMTETARTKDQVSYTLNVSLKPNAPVGAFRDEIRILTNDPETATFPVLVTGQIRGDLTASPNPLALGTATSSAGAQGKFVVRASKPFQIEAIDGSGDGFKMYETDASSRPMHVVTVLYNPEEGKLHGEVSRTFKILTDLPGEPAVELTATLRVEP